MNLGRLRDLIDKSARAEKLGSLAWSGSFGDYLSIVLEDPRVLRRSAQRLHDMVVSHGVLPCGDLSKGAPSQGDPSQGAAGLDEPTAAPAHYRLFDDPLCGGENAVQGLAAPLAGLVESLRVAALGGDRPSRSLLSLEGPLAQAKPAIATLLRQGLESYCRAPEGAAFSFRWILDEGGEKVTRECPIREEPLRLVPPEPRKNLLAEVVDSSVGTPVPVVDGGLCPTCLEIYEKLLKKHHGDWARMVESVQVFRWAAREDCGLAVVSSPEGLAGGLERAHRGLLELEGEPSAWTEALDRAVAAAEARSPLDVVILL